MVYTRDWAMAMRVIAVLVNTTDSSRDDISPWVIVVIYVCRALRGRAWHPTESSESNVSAVRQCEAVTWLSQV